MAGKRALISVSDKTGISEFASELVALGYEIISTGGTAKSLREAGLAVLDISEVTGFPEMMDGRVKTLHPRVHGGILHIRSNPQHVKEAQENGIEPIDLVCVNLYPFRQTVARPDVTIELAIENIDIGGPSMVRSAAKNYRDVIILVDPSDYSGVLDSLKSTGDVSPAQRARLATRAFAHTAAYDAAISSWLEANVVEECSREDFPENLALGYRRVQTLRYGENPHQEAAFYAEAGFPGISLANAKQLGGKELSYNNIMDLDAALGLILEFNEPACAIIKHTNPCGLAVRGSAAEAFTAARNCDPLSAFGGIIAINRVVDSTAAEAITGPNTFFEAVVAPGFDEEALPILKEKKKWGANLRLLSLEMTSGVRSGRTGRFVEGGLLLQSPDLHRLNPEDLKVVSKRQPTTEEIEELLFAWRAVKHVKSNAIVLTRDKALVGVGAGQMNRVGSVKIAAAQAGDLAKGAVLASDAFFPKPDGPQEAAEAGITAIIQPGGSVEDPNVIEVADRYNLAMVFTGVRHFRH